MPSLNPQRRRICYLQAIYNQNSESANSPDSGHLVGMVTLLVSPLETCFTFCGPDAIRLGMDLLGKCDLVVAWGLNRHFRPALARSGVEVSLPQVPVLDLDRLIAAETGQEQTFRDVYAHTFGEPEVLTPDDHTALFMLGRHETCQRLNEEACRKLRWLHQNGIEMGILMSGPEGAKAPTCITVDWRQMWPCG